MGYHGLSAEAELEESPQSCEKCASAGQFYKSARLSMHGYCAMSSNRLEFGHF
jgi:hypothetical protein